MAEKARRTRAHRATTTRPRVRLTDDEVLDLERPPEARNGVTSLVLDRSHVFSDLYYKKARYKVYWGGRGSAKSWAFAEALIRLTAAMPLRILCLREFQNSIKQSSHKMLVDTIARLGMQAWFHVTATSITSRVGAEFMFQGCFANLNSLRSTVGIDICWLEEAHSISEASWRVIIPTIRENGSEIWVSFNMDDEMDATYRRLVANRRPDAIVHHVNYDSNPYFPDTLRAEMEYDKATDYHLYEHIWLGAPRKVSNAIVLSGKYVVRDFDTEGWKEDGQDERLYYGLDYGYSTSPAALVRMWVREHTELIQGAPRNVKSLMLTHEAYGTHVEQGHEFIEWMESVPGTRQWPIKADAARPETTSWLKNNAFNVSSADKWQGSVEDGIAHLRGYHEIVIHPRCVNAAREAHLWRYKVDQKVVDEHGQPLVLPILVKRHDNIWDASRYGLDGQIQRGGIMGLWERLGREAPPDLTDQALQEQQRVEALYARLAQ